MSNEIERIVKLADEFYKEHDYKEAFPMYEKAANAGNPRAQHRMGVMYANAEGVKADAKAAVSWYEKAANAGYVDSQYNLGHLYVENKLIKKNAEIAFKWFSMAAQSGDKEAQYFVALLYYTGDGVKQDYEKAMHWCLKSANQGDSDAQTLLNDLKKKLPESHRSANDRAEPPKNSWFHKSVMDNVAKREAEEAEAERREEATEKRNPEEEQHIKLNAEGQAACYRTKNYEVALTKLAEVAKILNMPDWNTRYTAKSIQAAIEAAKTLAFMWECGCGVRANAEMAKSYLNSAARVGDTGVAQMLKNKEKVAAHKDRLESEYKERADASRARVAASEAAYKTELAARAEAAKIAEAASKKAQKERERKMWEQNYKK